MNDQLAETILIVGTVGLKQSEIDHPDQLAALQSAVAKKYAYVNRHGEYKLTLKGQKAFKDVKREWVVEIGHIPTGETQDVSIEELMTVMGKRRWW